MRTSVVLRRKADQFEKVKECWYCEGHWAVIVCCGEGDRLSHQGQMSALKNLEDCAKGLKMTNQGYLERLEQMRHIHIVNKPKDTKGPIWASWPPVYVKPGKMEYKLGDTIHQASIPE